MTVATSRQHQSGHGGHRDERPFEQQPVAISQPPDLGMAPVVAVWSGIGSIAAPFGLAHSFPAFRSVIRGESPL
jgi:hypothetical protein